MLLNSVQHTDAGNACYQHHVAVALVMLFLDEAYYHRSCVNVISERRPTAPHDFSCCVVVSGCREPAPFMLVVACSVCLNSVCLNMLVYAYVLFCMHQCAVSMLVTCTA